MISWLRAAPLPLRESSCTDRVLTCWPMPSYWSSAPWVAASDCSRCLPSRSFATTDAARTKTSELAARKRHHLLNGASAEGQHQQAIEAEGVATRPRHAFCQRGQEAVVDWVCAEAFRLAAALLTQHAPALFGGIRELPIAVRQLHAARVQ